MIRKPKAVRVQEIQVQWLNVTMYPTFDSPIWLL